MADRQSNIRIVFTKDTAALVDIKNLASQAQASTDKLQQSAKNLGTGFAEGSRKSVQSLEAMNLQLARLKAQITLTTDPKLINQLSNQYKQLKVQIDNTTKAVFQQAQAFKMVQKETQSFSQTIGQLYQGVRLFLAAGLIKSTVTAALEMAKLAGQVEGVKRAFDRLPGSLVLLEDLRKATQGTLTDFDLMQRALQAKNFKIPLQQLATFFQFATKRAQETGQSVDYLVNSIVFGLGFQSIRRLDNVQISGAEIRKTMKELGVSINEAFSILVQREVKKTGEAIETAATDAARLDANLEKVRQTFATKVTDSGWIKVLNSALDQLAINIKAIPRFDIGESFLGKPLQFFRDWKDNMNAVAQAERNVAAAAQELRDIQSKAGETNKQQIDFIIKELIFRTERIRVLGQEQVKFKAQLDLQKLQIKNSDDEFGQMVKLEPKLKSLRAEIEGIGRRLSVDQLVATELGKMLKELTSQKGGPDLGLIEAKLAEIEEVSDNIKTAKSVTEIHNLNLELARLKGELADLEAFGTTKQFLQVNGILKLVPVIAPKGSANLSSNKTIDFSKQNDLMELLGANRAFGELLNSSGGKFQIEIPVVIKPSKITPKDEWDKLGDALKENIQNIQQTGLDITQNFLMSQIQMETQAFDARIQKTRDFYDQQITLAGDNERRKTELRIKEDREIKDLTKKRADAEQKAAKASILVNTALGIIKAIATATSIYDGLVKAALVAAEGAAQYAVANSTKYYAKGEVNITGPGTKTSDSINAKISKGESVINADSTSRSLKLLEGINAGKIDDSILSKLHLTREGVKVMPADNSDIVKAIKDQKQQNLLRIGSDIYEVKKSDDGFSEMLRLRTMSKRRK